jgi:hypothetical protein
MIDSPTVLFDDAQRLRAGSAVSWGAILAGAVAAVSTTILLLALGSGLGLASVSPWGGRGVSATTFAITGIIWLIVTQWISSAIGGYLSGRLRHRWLATHAHEAFFRDTAHGLVAWSVATVAVVLIAGSSLGSLLGGAAKTGAMAGAMAAPAMHAMPMAEGPGREGTGHMDRPPMDDAAYGADKLFRAVPGSNGGSGPEQANARAEAMHIGAKTLVSGDVADDDRRYLIALTAARTGASPEEAQMRVDAFIAQLKDMQARAKAAADEARKAAAQTAIYTALAMLIGAFIASVSGAIGGRLRDEHV